VVEALRPRRGGFLRPFGCGEFIHQFLLGKGPYGSPRIDPEVGACQGDIFYHHRVNAIAKRLSTSGYRFWLGKVNLGGRYRVTSIYPFCIPKDTLCSDFNFSIPKPIRDNFPRDRL